MSQAFEITVDDVETVLRAHALRIANTEGAAFDAMAERLLPLLDHAAIEHQALKAGLDLDEQTAAARAEILRQLKADGVIA